MCDQLQRHGWMYAEWSEYGPVFVLRRRGRRYAAIVDMTGGLLHWHICLGAN